MRERFCDLFCRLTSVRDSLGEEAFEQACRAAKVSIGRVVLARAEADAACLPVKRRLREHREDSVNQAHRK